MSIEEVLNSLPAEEVAAEPKTEESQDSTPGEVEAPASTPTEPTEHTKEPGMVPLAALQEERERRREMQTRIQQMETRFGQMLESFNRMTKPAEAEGEPTYDDDPLGATYHKLDKLQQQIDSMSHGQAIQAQQVQLQQLQAHVGAQENAFRQQHQDYDDAIAWMQNRRRAELAALGYDEGVQEQVINHDAQQIVLMALRQGKAVPDFVYEAAKNMGYTSKGKPQAAVSQAIAPSSLGEVAGEAGDAMPSLAEISKLNDADFDKVFKKYFPA